MNDLEHKGYYWIQLSGDSFWQPARWIQPVGFDAGWWKIIGHEHRVESNDVAAVGERIVKPS